MIAAPLRILVFAVGHNAWVLGFDLACACDTVDGRMHHPALTIFVLAVFNLAAGWGAARAAGVEVREVFP